MAKSKTKEELTQDAQEKPTQEKSNKKEVDILDVARKSIEKKYGTNIMSRLGDHADVHVDTISTGCLSLDAATGVGGLARGRIYEIVGIESSGKTTLAISTALEALRRGLKVLYIDAEHALDPSLIKQMGTNMGVSEDLINSIELVQAFTGDDNLDIAAELMSTGALDVVVIDSVASLLPKAMEEGDIGDNYIGQLSRLMSKACSKLTPIVNRNNTLLIFINQFRTDIHKYGDKHVSTGGMSLPYYATGRIKVEGGDTKASRILNSDGVVIGHTNEFTVIKNKLKAPHREARANLLYGIGYDFVAEVARLSVDLGLVNQTGQWYEVDGRKVQGMKSLEDIFREDVTLYEDTRAKVKAILGLK